jgi:hypothetical protein
MVPGTGNKNMLPYERWEPWRLSNPFYRGCPYQIVYCCTYVPQPCTTLQGFSQGYSATRLHKIFKPLLS